MVFDARRTNARHHRPRHALPGVVEAIAAVDVIATMDESTESGRDLVDYDLCASDADLQDGFYQMSEPRLASWFGICDAFRVDALGISSSWSVECVCVVPVDPHTLVYPVMDAMVMGWSWGLFFFNEVCALAAFEVGDAFGGLGSQIQPAPHLSCDSAACSIYSDDSVALAPSQKLAEESHDGIVAASSRKGSQGGEVSSRCVGP